MKLKKIVDENSQLTFATLLKVIIDWIDYTVMVIIAGRGAAKSSEIHASRFLRVIEDMPGAPLAFIADTYVNLSTNILPAVKLGWYRKQYYEGIHYVCNQAPPEEWKRKCSIIVDDFRHTIFWYNGCVIFGGSLDRPSLLAGKSVCYLASDEAKYQKDERINRAMPILRGDATRYKYSVYFLGMTITTDMPNVTEGEYDWAFRFAKDMNPQRVAKTLVAFDLLNKIRIKLYNELNGKNRPKKLEELEREEEDRLNKWNKIRYGQTFFMNASSFLNIQVLTLKYVKGLFTSLGVDELRKSVLGERPTLKKTLRFYTKLSEKHFFNDGNDYDAYYDQFGFNGAVRENSLGLKYLRKNDILEAGFDTGNMKSFVIGQPDGEYYRLLKFLYVIPTHSFRELGDQFLEYFAKHEKKIIDVYHDRQANNFQQLNEDAAGKLKEAIEYDRNGKRTGWEVNLKSRGQGNLFHKDEYEFMIELMGEENPNLPKLRIDAYNCKQVKSSMEKAPARIIRKGDQKLVEKNKASEKLPYHRLPMESTNPSDAVKYLLMRPEWLKISKPKKQRSFVGMSVE
jgi:hypothetical protein